MKCALMSLSIIYIKDLLSSGPTGDFYTTTTNVKI